MYLKPLKEFELSYWYGNLPERFSYSEESRLKNTR